MDKATESQTFMHDGRRAELRKAEELARLQAENAELRAALQRLWVSVAPFVPEELHGDPASHKIAREAHDAARAALAEGSVGRGDDEAKSRRPLQSIWNSSFPYVVGVGGAHWDRGQVARLLGAPA